MSFSAAISAVDIVDLSQLMFKKVEPVLKCTRFIGNRIRGQPVRGYL